MRRTLIALVGLLIAGSVQAQTPGQARPAGPPPAASGEIRGTVVDDANAPIPAATIAVRSRADSSLVAGAVGRDNGSFHIQGLRPGAYYLRVTSMGFSPRSSAVFTISAAAPRASVGNMKLSRFAVTLQSVDVTVEQATVTIEPDRNTYRAKDVAPAASNASEVLQATPSVEVDADGKVSLRGNENVAVQINGRPAPIRGAQLGAYLKQLPAAILDRIEIIPTPSARHDPEGMAGIINIVLKESVDLGTSGGFTIGASPSNRYNLSGNLGYQAGALTLFGSYGFNSDERTIVGINDRERFDASHASMSFTEQDIGGETTNPGHNLNTSIDYKLNSRDVLSGTFAVNRRRSTDISLADYTEWSGSRSLLDSYNRLRDTKTKGLMFDQTIAFKRTFEPRKHELSTEIRFNRSADDDRTGLWRQPPPGAAGSGVARTELETDENDAVTRQLTAQLDYTRTLAERTKLETGYKGTARWLDRDFLVMKDALGAGNWVESNLSNSFDFDEQVHAAYGVLSHGIGKFELQAGLRAERASRDFLLAAERYPYNYTSLFPSGVISYKLSGASQAKISYSRRIRRPGTWELNPFPQFFDPQNVFIGNPELNPEYTDAFELGWNRTWQLGTLQVSPFYRRTTDVIRFIINTTDVVDGREVTSVTFENLATGTSWGTDVNGSLRFGSRFSGFGGFNIYKMVTDGGSVTSLSSNAVTWSGRVNGTTQLSPRLSLQGMYFYRAPINVERGRFSGSQMVNLVLRQKLRGDRATLSLRVTDPFNTMGFRVEAGDDNLLQITERKFDVRAVHMTFQYTFGQAPRLRQRPEPTPEPAPVFQ